MLHELLQAAKGLADAGIAPANRHADVKDVAKGPALRIRLSADGSITEIEGLNIEDGRRFWTLRDGQQNGFPFLKTTAGLIDVTRSPASDAAAAFEAAKTDQDKRAALRLLIASQVPPSGQTHWPKESHVQRVEERRSALLPLASDPTTAAVPAAFERFIALARREPDVRVPLREAISRAIDTAPGHHLSAIAAALTKPIGLLIDPEFGFERDATDSDQAPAVSRALVDTSPEAGQEGNSTCSISGHTEPLVTENFPQPTLPVLGQTFIFSRNKDIPSFARYRRSAANSLPVGRLTAESLAAAATWLTASNQEIKTWRSVPGEAPDSSDLLLAFAPKHAQLPIIDVLAEDDDEFADDEATIESPRGRFLRLTTGILETIDGKRSAERDPVHVLVLRAVDPANRKAIFSRQLTVARLRASAERWDEAIRQAPDITLPIPRKGLSKGTPPMAARPPAIAPLSIPKLTRVGFVRNGTEKVKLAGLGADFSFALFLGEGDGMRHGATLLRCLVERRFSLMAAVGHAVHRGMITELGAEAKRDALATVTGFTIGLHALGRNKDSIMDSTGYRLGQLLAAFDYVHAGYCAAVRDGAQPPMLIGNATLALAGRDPKGALAQLQARLPPYLAWARREGFSGDEVDKASDEDGADESKAKKAEARKLSVRSSGSWHAWRLKETAHDLRGDLSSVVSDDAFRAELLLGYLAGYPSMKKKTAAIQASTGEK